MLVTMSVLGLIACSDKGGEDTQTEDTQVEVIDPGPFTQVAAADTFTCGLRENGSVECWGTPLQETGQTSPPDDVVFTKIAVGRYHGCGVTTDQSIVCWGTPLIDYGQTQAPAALDYIDVAVGDYHTCAITADQTVTCFGDDSQRQITDQTPTAVQIDASGNLSGALTTTNDADVWGELGDDPDNHMDDGEYNPIPDKYVFVAVGSTQYGCGARGIEDVLCWGDSTQDVGQMSPPTGVYMNYLTAASYHTCGLESDGRAWCWGMDDVGQSSPPVGERFVQIDAGLYHTCGVTTDERVVCWGENFQGQSSPPLDP